MLYRRVYLEVASVFFKPVAESEGQRDDGFLTGLAPRTVSSFCVFGLDLAALMRALLCSVCCHISRSRSQGSTSPERSQHADRRPAKEPGVQLPGVCLALSIRDVFTCWRLALARTCRGTCLSDILAELLQLFAEAPGYPRI